MKLPRISMATKLYAIFALLATVTIALAAVAVVAALVAVALTKEFEVAFAGALSVERSEDLAEARRLLADGVDVSGVRAQLADPDSDLASIS